ncbi:uncharacterized protein LOC119085478 [Bradysia coprophila]|uniref:uncharacterized protein LOC119085478 n=1 Tax=Bradysia coprophila TaxID=38358 RepID=UPI00187D8D7A|nr:uncharacterized protein LOC119085478 [Bradysia coprophila]
MIFGAASHRPEGNEEKEPNPPGSHKSSKSSITTKQRIAALKRLEEEQAIRLDVLAKKYRIIGASDDESDSTSRDDKERCSKTSSVDNTLKWARDLQDISKEFSKITFMDEHSVSSSDHEREVVNTLSSDQLRSNFLASQVSGQSKNILRPSVLLGGKAERQSTNTQNASNHHPETFDFHHKGAVPKDRTFRGLFGAFGHRGLENSMKRSRIDDDTTVKEKIKFNPRTNDPMNTRQPATTNSKFRESETHAQDSLKFRRNWNNFQPPNNQQSSMDDIQDRLSAQYHHQVKSNNDIGIDPTSFGGIPNFNNTRMPSTFNFNPSPAPQLNFGVQESGYVSLPPAQLTRNQIASRHVFKELPDFDGKPEDWPLYLSALKTSTVACGYTDTDNLGRLQRSLKGDVLSMFGCRLVHARAVPGVIEALHLIFGRPSLIIHQLLKKINETPSPQADDLGSLIKFAIAVQNLCATIESSNDLDYLHNPILIQTVIDKLPTQIQLNWAYFKVGVAVADLSTLGKWLYHLAQVATSVINPSALKFIDKSKNDSKKKNPQQNQYSNAHSESGSSKTSNDKSKCPVCETASHKLVDCRKFKQNPIDERWNLVRKFKKCGRCFENHHWTRCKSKKKCGKDGCNANHHVLLHNTVAKPVAQIPAVTETQIVPHSSNAHRTVSVGVKNPDIFRIVPVILSYNNKSIRIFAFLDDGSNLTSLEESVANHIGALGTIMPLCVLWSMGKSHQVDTTSRQITVNICGTFDEAQQYTLKHVRTVKKLNLPSQSITQSWLNHYPHMKDVPVSTYTDARPQLIIGLQYSHLMVSLNTKEGDLNQPILCWTRLGWTVQGPNDQGGQNQSSKYGLTMCECQSDDPDLHRLMAEYFSIENFGVKATNLTLESKELTRARHLMESMIIRQGNRFVSPLLWRTDDIHLPNNYGMALRRLQCVETKMQKDSVLAEKMRLYIADFIQKGYIRRLLDTERNITTSRTWYLPIFPVFNPKKPEKFRIVWDGAAKVNGHSLNSNLLVGPDLLMPLPDILRRFRQRKIAITGDIKEMFHQVLVCPADQDSQRFLWRDGDINRNPDVYVMNVMTFGSSCSPSIAQWVKNKNASDFKEQFPRAYDAITRSHYVDDLIDNTHTEEEAVQLIQDVQFIHRHAGFEMRNFASNSKDVLRSLNSSSENVVKTLDDKINLTTERVLGLYWNTELDTFTYCLKFVKVHPVDTHPPTKRQILSAVMSIFDPLGFLAHFVIYVKILLQDIWREKIDWDDMLSDDMKNRWRFWLQHLPQVENVHIPRLYSPRISPVLPELIQLHVFVDASLEAYAAAAYFRIENNSGVDSCLVEAKSRVAPIKPMSVPRLELQGGILGTRLASSIVQSHDGLQIDKIIIWCDSRTVLAWINSDLRRYSQFVAFRVAEILDSSHKIDWRWIPSNENVADEATKSKKSLDLDMSSRWFQGPDFLRDQDSNWTFELEEPEFKTTEELRPMYLLSHIEQPVQQVVEFERFSNWRRLVRTVAYVFRFINNMKTKRGQRLAGVFSSKELLCAESFLYKSVQQSAFGDEIAIIQYNVGATADKQKEFPTASVIRTTSAYIDDIGVMRVRGRIDAATSISDTMKRPIILDRHHYVTHLIVDFYHRKYKHLNNQTVLNEIRQFFYIPRLRVLLNQVRHNCQMCKNRLMKPKVPEMAPLPEARLAVHVRPFTYVGIDYFGPMKVVFGRGTVKRWGVLFTCLTTRAIHLEIAHSLDTSSCIMAIYNFIGRRGQPKVFYSDNGTNLHGAHNTLSELREEFKKLKQDRIQEEFTTSDFMWTFNPPVAPHMGGSWERMIQTVKKCLDESMTSRYPTDEVLQSLFIEAENIVNSRPLTYVALDSPYDEVLTPNHFLIGSSNGYKPPHDFNDSDLLRNSWRTAQAMADKFWYVFVMEYLPTITQRSKWLKKVKPLQVDDVVLIVDAAFKRNTWPKGLVVETHKDKNGIVRSAKIRTDLGTFLTRPVSQLVVLDVRKESVQQIELDVKLRSTGSVNGVEDVGQH